MEPMLTALATPQAYPHPTQSIILLETHISWVFLTGPYAYKVKKPVNLGFVDFSSLEKRRHFCQEELRLNQRLAPNLYLDVVDIHGPAERANLRGSGPVIEVAVRMRQFSQGGLLIQALQDGGVNGEQLERFAEQLASFHDAAAVAGAEGPYGTANAVVAPALTNLEVLAKLQPAKDPQSQLLGWTLREAARLEPVFAERLRLGRVREGHGDLHLGNLVVHQGEVVAFDCLEFNPTLRWIDVLSDVAFLAMDLQQRGEAVLAGRVLNRWLSTCGDYASLATWRWYLTYRALVRAKVLALRLEQLKAEQALTEGLPTLLDSYLHQAQTSSGAVAPGALLLTHGVSGSGKSHIALELCRRHGWVHLRSDVERRRLFGLWGTPVASMRQGERYSPTITAELYNTILPAAAESVLQAGLTTVVDATFLKRQQRERFYSLAKQVGAPCLLLTCAVPNGVALERIGQRQMQGLDPSEADGWVLARQVEELEPLDGEEGPQVVVGSIEEVEDQLRAQLPGPFRTTR